jgi:anaerobic ribonucleoside-triphosphate reductase activating protein
MNIHINKVHFPVTVLGPGKRLGIWVQGCNINCPGCVSQDTWKTSADSLMPIDLLLASCRVMTDSALDGVTISGGEPFEQPAALRELLDGLHEWRLELAQPFDILCYSGFPLTYLQKHHSAILSQLDAIITEPFDQSVPRGKVWRGSTNQPLIMLSDFGREKYNSCLNDEYRGKGTLQVSVDEQRIWYIGIPDRTDMDSIQSVLEQKGIIQERVSWRA